MKKLVILAIGIVVFLACKKEATEIAQYDSSPYALAVGPFPKPDIAADNELTIQGVQLGRMLFYEKKLSKDGSMACASCHNQVNSFSDITALSVGVDKLNGKRNAMPIVNLAWHKEGFFWDGRAATLRIQSLKPIQDVLEMHETLENVVTKLKADKVYTDQFTRAFKDPEITSEKVSLALEQFMVTMVSFNSRFDQYKRGEIQLSDSEKRGEMLFNREKDPLNGIKGAECFHCHGGYDFANFQYTNNGLESDNQFTDLGRYNVTKLDEDKARFKVPTLRNIELTGPYMHDGRFATLEEVIEHYNSGVKFSSTLDPLLTNVANEGLELSSQDKQDLINFLKTLTDQEYIKNTKFSNPF